MYRRVRISSKGFSSWQKGQILCSNHIDLIVNGFFCWSIQLPLLLLPIPGTDQVCSSYSPLLAPVRTGVSLIRTPRALYHLMMPCLGSFTAHFMCLCIFISSLQHLYITGTNNCLLSRMETTSKLPKEEYRYI